MDLRSAGVLLITLLAASVPANGIPLKLQGTSPGAFVGEGINALAVALLQDSQQSPASNVAFSPLGHAAVLAALAEGAGGATQGELLAALRLPRDAPLGRAAYRAVLSRLQEKKKLNKPEFRSWFYVYKTAVQVEKYYADLLRDNYLMEVHDIDAPENELPSELADKRKPGVQQGSSSTDEDLPEIPFEKPTSTEKPATEQPSSTAPSEPSLAEKPVNETKSDTQLQQEAPTAESPKPSVEVVQQETNESVNVVEEQINTQTISSVDIIVPATELLPPLEDTLPPAVQPDKKAPLEPVDQVLADQSVVKSEQPPIVETPQVEEETLPPVPFIQETVKSEETKPVEEIKNEQAASIEQQAAGVQQGSSEHVEEPEKQPPIAVEQSTLVEQLPEAQPAVETEKLNDVSEPLLNDGTKTQEETVKEPGKSEEKKIEKGEIVNGEKPTNLVEPSVSLDSEMAESSWDAESREAISSRAPASPITAFNALYFRGAWATPFDGRQSAPFNLSPNNSVTVNMLSTVGFFRIGDIPELFATAIELPYNGVPNRYSLLVLLPQDTEGALNKLTTSLSTRTLRSLGRYMTERLVHVQIPEFEIGYVSYPQAAFRKLGIKAALDANLSEFPGISRSQRLFLQPDALAQLVRFRVDATSSSTNFLSTSSLGSSSGPAVEPPAPPPPSEGAEAAAATRSGALQFRADRPFIFVLRDNVDKLTLVAGRIADPASRPVPPLLP